MNLSLIQRNKSYYRKRIDYVLAEMDVYGAQILDLGCGEMVLKEAIGDNTEVSYFGIDQFHISSENYFLQADILDYGQRLYKQFDFIFCLGVLDHLTIEKANSLLDIFSDKYSKLMVMSMSNRRNPFLRGKRINMLDRIDYNVTKVLYLLKFPFTQILLKLPSEFVISKILATEVIYFCLSKGR